MAFKFSIPFFAFRLHLHPGLSLLAPLSDHQALRIGQPLSAVAKQYADALQQKVLNTGNYRAVLEEYREGDFYRSVLEASFPAAPDRLSFPAFSLEFDYYFNRQEKGYWGIVPALKLEAFADDEPQLAALLKEAVQLDFSRKKRLQAVQDIVSAIWFESIELKQHAIDFEAYTPAELELLQEQRKSNLLSDVATLLVVKSPACYGMEKELEQLVSTLKSKFVRNVLLVGPSGVGKTALVWELARQQRRRRVKEQFWETTASTLIKELSQEMGWQENLSQLCREISGSDNILFIRNLAELFEVGMYEGNSISMADYLGAFLSRGEITMISECTEEELARIELKNPQYLSFFQQIHLKAPEGQALEAIISQKVQDVAQLRQTEIEEEAIREAIRLSRRFEPYSGMPGKPIRFLESLLLDKKRVAGQDAASIKLSRSEVIHRFCQQTGIPRFMVDPAIPMDITAIKAAFNSQLFGQEAAVESVVGLLAAVKTALTRIGKPIASLLFLGPTGVGKTELAKVLAQFMFGGRDRLTRFDMSEYSNAYSVLRLTGEGFFSEGLLTSAVRRAPFSVLLFDEIEKAHPQFFDLLLQILEGRLTDSQGKLANFCSTIIIMTSNIGAQNLAQNPIGWKQQISGREVQQHFITAAEDYFQPELFNRIDKVIPFTPLDQDTVRFVVDREIQLIRQREGIRFRRMNLHIENEVLDYLGEQGYDPRYGARHLQRTIREYLLTPLSRALNTQDIDDQLEVEVRMRAGRIQIDIASDPLGLELLLEEYGRIQHSDYASRLRRKIEQIKDGHLYTQLINELAFFEQKRAAAKQRFWDNLPEANRYSAFQESNQEAEHLYQRIQDLEMGFATSSLGVVPYKPAWENELRAWEERLFEFKLRLCSRLNPENNQCCLSIYGAEPEPLVQLYTSLFQAKGFQFEAYGVWFRESYYNEEVLEQTDKGIARHKRKQYIKQIIDMATCLAPFNPPEPGDVLWGVEFTISSPCAYLYLEEEGGGQKWEGRDGKDRFYMVLVSKTVEETPNKLHRKEFYEKMTPRRTITPQELKDRVYKINRECNKSALLGFIMEKLDERFAVQLDKELL